MWGEDMIALVVGWVDEFCSEPCYYSNYFIPFSLECSCPYGVNIGCITAGWVGECCSELDTPADIS